MHIFTRRAKRHLKILAYRKILLFTLAVIFSLSAFTLVLGTVDVQKSAPGHWAGHVIDAAYLTGIIRGNGGDINPCESVSAAQILAVLSRVLNYTVRADISDMNIRPQAWYKDYIAKTVRAGLICPAQSDMDFSAPATRQDAFRFISEAFSVMKANPDVSLLADFSDSWQISEKNRGSAAALVSVGVVHGFDGRLSPNAEITMAEFLSVVNRISEAFIFGPSANNLDSANFDGHVWFDFRYPDISLIETSAPNVIVRSEYLNSLVIGGAANIGRLTLASQSGDVYVLPGDYASVNTVAVASGGGTVTVGSVENVEITGHRRNVIISSDVELITVSGRDNLIQINEGVNVSEIRFMRGASGNLLELNGNAAEIDVLSPDVVLLGGGYAGVIYHSYPDIRIGIRHGRINNNIDHGINGAYLSLSVQPKLPVGETLRAEAGLHNVPPGRTVEVTWYLDGIEKKRLVTATGRSIPVLRHDFEYYFGMAETAEVKIVLRHETALGQLQIISEATVVEIENRPMEYFAAAVRARVTSHYKGDFTTEWAYENDLTDLEKELWINTGDFTSRTDYLVWMNLDYQRVNIFRWCEEYDQWRIIRTSLGASGREPGQRTRTGATYLSAHQPEWRAPAFVRPIVRFWPGTGHAFHSRPLNSREEVIDERIGFPVSLGCIRMYCEDIWFLYNYIPLRTTLVVF